MDLYGRQYNERVALEVQNIEVGCLKFIERKVISDSKGALSSFN
jgi:hypothetical protein